MEFKKIISFVVLLCFTFLSKAQIEFNRVYNGTGYDEGHGLIQLADSGFMVAGTSSSFENAPSQAFLMRLNKQGYVVWSKAYGGSESEMGRRVILRPNLGYYLFGTSNSGVSGNFDFYVAFTNLNGDLQWEKRFDRGGWERLNDALMLSDTSFILIGETDSNTANLPNQYMLRMDKDGAMIWDKQTGNSGTDYWRAVSKQTDTTVVLAGSVYSNDSLMPKGYLANYHINGTKLWDTIVGNYGEYLLNEVHFANNQWVISGQNNLVGNSDYNGYILRLNATFGFLSLDDNKISSSSERFDQFNNFTYNSSQNYCLVSHKIDVNYTFPGGEDAQVSIYTPTLIWGGYGVNYGTIGQDAVNEMIQTNDGFIAFVGYHNDQNVGGSSCFVVKLGAEFNYPSGLVPTPLSILFLDEIQNDNITVYPNPFLNEVHIDVKDAHLEQLVLYAANGQVVWKQTSGASFDSSQLPAGMYILEVFTSKGKGVRKLVK